MPQARFCRFCVNGITDIDYKDTATLQRFTSSYAKIVPRRKSGACATHQRKLAMAIKRARTIALLPYVNQ
ncbi:30S ribosomal protein S18 [Candidatus Uhrbacteria bacterium CG10_big_fil_rev_8_21_14_0_10_48_11]|uniref:Small ribosomal subunit protein bS18 n=1 Tax=Candidatus Uhrbacteria bacterium CG10_big_fil_rev_8_21_14_0_10_48_11 TaxID=1975037 RepID=A0A2M8LDP9_9BACT|nr:MAG: 30S ribosomal protein S18 [Candidatus Uhrbacteria bacterium CG10_big_fil_rev_8_21_14_0_10_48_11]